LGKQILSRPNFKFDVKITFLCVKGGGKFTDENIISDEADKYNLMPEPLLGKEKQEQPG